MTADPVDPRNYTQATRYALIKLSGGFCYYPGCPEPILVRRSDGKFSFTGQIAHIRAAYPNGPRYSPKMTNDQRRDARNLLLFCKPHHDLVDKERPKDFTVTRLRRWKDQREADPLQALERLRAVTPTGLKQIVADGMKSRDDSILQALTRLHESDQEAAALIRNLINELTEVYTERRATLGPDDIALFSNAVRNLHLGEDDVTRFASAVYDLHLGPDDITRFQGAVKRLESIWSSGLVESFIRAAYRLPGH